MKKSDIQFAILSCDIVLFRFHENELQVLVGEVLIPEFKGKQGLVGGLVAPKETAKEAAVRHLKDKAGITSVHLEQLYTFSEVDRDPRGRVVSVAYLGLAPSDPRKQKGDRPTQFIPVKKARALAYDHDRVVAVGLERLQAKLTYTNIAQHLLPKEFTLTELQMLYEAILGTEIDKRNFRKKIQAVGLVVTTGNKRQGEANRPAELYRFTSTKPQTIEIL